MIQKDLDGKDLHNTLLITKSFPVSSPGGRELLNKMNYEVLVKIFGSNLSTFFLSSKKNKNLFNIMNSFKGHIDGIDKHSINCCMDKIRDRNIQRVFIDGSNLGLIAKVGKKMFPHVQFITFFHNAEYYFFQGLFKNNYSLKAFIIMIIVYFNERRAVIWSDILIALNQRDAKDIKSLYGGGDIKIYPMSLKDQLKKINLINRESIDEEYAIFVGGFFYANYYGMKWFVKEVVPLINIKILIIGRGFEAVRDELEVPGKVVVIGGVDDLNKYYLNAKFVVAPIFDGSGMKTKTAEALMFGKKVVGTNEAFIGYEQHSSDIGWLCHNAEEFSKAIEEATASIENYFDHNLREIYELHYSFDAALKNMNKILTKPNFISPSEKINSNKI